MYLTTNHTMSKKLIDLKGQSFGRLTVLEYSPFVDSSGTKRSAWLCLCSCGKQKKIRVANLQRSTNSCGCLKIEKNLKKQKNLLGLKINSWTVIGDSKSYSPHNKIPRKHWLCKCDCGTEEYVTQTSLLNGKSKACRYHKRTKMMYSTKKLTLDSYINRCARDNIQFNLTEDEFHRLTQHDCYYCGIPPSNVQKSYKNHGDYIFNGIDRVDNKKGYQLDNVVTCCKQCNFAKRTSTVDEFLSMVKRIYERHKL